MARDHVIEIRSIQQRARGSVFPSDLDQLRDEWKTLGASKSARTIADFFPIRIVTLIEVFSGGWIAELVDHGEPYAGRAVRLDVNIKFDLPLVQSLHGQQITLGQLLAHGLSMHSIGSVEKSFSALLDYDLFQVISKTSDRREREAKGSAAEPIIKDLAHMRKALARLFEVRHILVHELPIEPPYERQEIDQFLDAATQFVEATDETLYTMLHGHSSPITQHEMNAQARADAEAAQVELSNVVQKIAERDGAETIFEVQKLWEAFKEAEATRRADEWKGGSGWPMLYHSAQATIIKNRTRELTSG
jgi:Lysozyme inhibitor LprI